MTWFKVDDQFPRHPKVLRAGTDAAWLFIAGGCYCAQYLTDGKIPKGAVAGLTALKRPAVLADRLVEAGLWHDHDDDYFEVHDYLLYNPSRAEVEAERERRSKAGAKGAAKRWLNGSHSSHSTHTEQAGTGASNAPGPSRPDPLVSKETEKRRKRRPPVDYQPTAEQADYAKTNGLTLEGEVADWVVWCEANGRTYANVNAGFSTWLRRAVDYGRGKPPVATLEDLAEPLTPACLLCHGSGLMQVGTYDDGRPHFEDCECRK